jgi:predicted secreted hydrolase
VIDVDGTPTRLSRDEVVIEPTAWWTSPHTDGRYPIAWKVAVPGHEIDLEVRGLLPESELDGRATTGVVYWEGPVEATGSQRGEGYVELTGYAGSLDGLF